MPCVPGVWRKFLAHRCLEHRLAGFWHGRLFLRLSLGAARRYTAHRFGLVQRLLKLFLGRKAAAQRLPSARTAMLAFVKGQGSKTKFMTIAAKAQAELGPICPLPSARPGSLCPFQRPSRLRATSNRAPRSRAGCARCFPATACPPYSGSARSEAAIRACTRCWPSRKARTASASSGLAFASIEIAPVDRIGMQRDQKRRIAPEGAARGARLRARARYGSRRDLGKLYVEGLFRHRAGSFLPGKPADVMQFGGKANAPRSAPAQQIAHCPTRVPTGRKARHGSAAEWRSHRGRPCAAASLLLDWSSGKNNVAAISASPSLLSSNGTKAPL